MNVNDLTSLAGCKDYLFGPKPSPASDSVLSKLITAESKAFLGLTYRSTFAPTTKSVILDGNGSDIMMIVDFPLLAVSSLIIDGVTVPAAPTTPPTAASGYYFDSNGRITLVGGNFSRAGAVYGGGWAGSGGGFYFSRARKNVFITYTYGFQSIPVVDELQNIPATQPLTITPANAFWLSDVGVKYFIGGTPLTRVFVAPATGQYFVDPQTGIYQFAVADAGLPVLLSYNYSGVPEDVQQCVNEMVGFVYGNRGSIGITSEQISGMQNVSRLQTYPTIVRDTIYYYRRRFRGPSS